MQGSKAIVLAQQKLWWMSAAAKYRCLSPTSAGPCRPAGPFVRIGSVCCRLERAQQLTGWRNDARSTPVGATLGLFFGTRLADLLERLSQRYSVHRVDGGAAIAFVLLVAWIIRPR